MHFRWPEIIRFEDIHLFFDRIGYLAGEWFLLFIVFIIAVPLIAVLVGLFRWIFGLGKGNRALRLGIFVLWVLAIIAVANIFISEKYEFEKTDEQTFYPELEDYENIYIRFSGKTIPADETYHVSGPEFEYSYDPDDKIVYAVPDFEIKRHNDDSYVRLEKKMMGFLDKEQYDQDAFSYHWHQEDSVLIFDPYFKSGSVRKGKIHELNVIINLSEDKNLIIDEKFRKRMDK
jgi:hypothetical protein